MHGRRHHARAGTAIGETIHALVVAGGIIAIALLAAAGWGTRLLARCLPRRFASCWPLAWGLPSLIPRWRRGTNGLVVVPVHVAGLEEVDLDISSAYARPGPCAGARVVGSGFVVVVAALVHPDALDFSGIPAGEVEQGVDGGGVGKPSLAAPG